MNLVVRNTEVWRTYTQVDPMLHSSHMAEAARSDMCATR